MAEIVVGKGSAEVGAIESRVEFEAPAEIFEGGRQVPKPDVDESAHRESSGVRVVELDRPVEIGQRRVVIAEVTVNGSAVAVRLRILWVELDGPVEILQRLLDFAKGNVRHTSIIVGGSKLGLESDGFAIVREGRCRITEQVMDVAAIGQSFGSLRIKLRYSIEVPECPLEVPKTA